MKAPLPPGAPIDMKRMRRWVGDFANYRHSITEGRIERWLSQFDLPDVDLAARVLDVVDFVSNEKVAQSFQGAVSSLPGWSTNPAKRKGRWRFAAFSSSAGESGDVMLQKLRHANNLARKSDNLLFVHKSELLKAGLTKGDRIVFVDDFSGTGKQVSDAWPELTELIPDGPDVHLILLAASKAAMARIEAETDLQVRADITLTAADQLFDDACQHFTGAEKATIGRYCNNVGPMSAEQFARAGFTIVFAHTCPNNTLPILHAVNDEWEGLFRRYD
jgi:hypothetical protein